MVSHINSSRLRAGFIGFFVGASLQGDAGQRCFMSSVVPHQPVKVAGMILRSGRVLKRSGKGRSQIAQGVFAQMLTDLQQDSVKSKLSETRLKQGQKFIEVAQRIHAERNTWEALEGDEAIYHINKFTGTNFPKFEPPAKKSTVDRFLENFERIYALAQKKGELVGFFKSFTGSGCFNARIDNLERFLEKVSDFEVPNVDELPDPKEKFWIPAMAFADLVTEIEFSPTMTSVTVAGTIGDLARVEKAVCSSRSLGGSREEGEEEEKEASCVDILSKKLSEYATRYSKTETRCGAFAEALEFFGIKNEYSLNEAPFFAWESFMRDLLLQVKRGKQTKWMRLAEGLLQTAKVFDI